MPCSSSRHAGASSPSLRILEIFRHQFRTGNLSRWPNALRRHCSNGSVRTALRRSRLGKDGIRARPCRRTRRRSARGVEPDLRADSALQGPDASARTSTSTASIPRAAVDDLDSRNWRTAGSAGNRMGGAAASAIAGKRADRRGGSSIIGGNSRRESAMRAIRADATPIGSSALPS